MESLLGIDVFKEIVDHSGQEVFVTDGTGKILYVNQASKRYYGMDAAQLIGKNIRDLEDDLFYPSATLEALRKREPVEIIQNTVFEKRLYVKAKPIFDERDEIICVISFAVDLTEMTLMKDQVNRLERKLSNHTLFPKHLIANCKSMKKTLQLVEKIANFKSSVLLKGEVGAGKKTIAQLIHSLSNRRHHDFLSINCSILKDRHTFSTEVISKITRGCTLYLDGIHEMPLNIQSHLNDFIKNKESYPLTTDLRIIASTTKDLDLLIKMNQFNEELYYHLNVVTINIPPLRDRKKDIQPLAELFLKKFNTKYGKKVHFSPVVVSAFEEYDWPGNVKELRNLIENLVLTAESKEVSLDHLPPKVRVGSISSAETLPEKLEKYEKTLIMEAYDLFNSSYKVAEHLGISQSTAIRKIQKYITKP